MTTSDLQGRVALVTGASRNIGRAIAVALAGRGADIVVHVANDTTAGRETVAAVEALGRRAVLVSGDLSNPEVAVRVVREAADAFGRLDVVVNNAAIRPEAAFADITYADWRKVMGVALDAVFLVSQAALQYLEKSDQAAIINLGGLTGHTGAAHRAHVITAKAGVVGLTKAMAHELSSKGMTVNCVAPGLIETVRISNDGAAPRHHGSRKNLVGRHGKPEEVAEAVAYLAGAAGRYVTGETLHVNGGAYLS
ncbi:3-oxoacyl-[acyl-carrier protein] reductase [Pseudorhizobium tarimense]|uniref:3-oxoacyl-[acyl-carrier protein] reductase n=1 Tax=Pseudorhizobium tarimense TaxID=1079109 RepID=A0ABV2H3F7_9HYPH|nr:SDR family oxidoreductase [Pseudorhizobium tarimense]MCJ8518505.1 SDR family oxidoreductase [Pseudorhizobium tarimense]